MVTIKESTTLKRAYCTRCKTENELNRIFEVNPDAEVCYCPFCMAKHKPKDVIEEYNFYISQKILKAKRLLYTETKFHEAYDFFASIIEIDPNNADARFGRLLALVYMSTLRKTYFNEAGILLTQEAQNYFRKLKSQEHYFKLITKINIAVDEYFERFQKRIMFKDRFYDVSCVELFYKRINEIIDLKNLFLDEMEKIRLKVQNKKIEHFYNNLLHDVEEKEHIYATRVITLDGGQYKPLKFNDIGNLILTKSPDYAQAYKYVKIKKLNPDDNGEGIIIKDKVYPDNSHITTVIKIITPLMLLFLLAGTASLLMFFFGLKSLKAYFLIGAISGYAISGLFAVLFVIWKHKLLKRRHLID